MLTISQNPGALSAAPKPSQSHEPAARPRCFGALVNYRARSSGLGTLGMFADLRPATSKRGIVVSLMLSTSVEITCVACLHVAVHACVHMGRWLPVCLNGAFHRCGTACSRLSRLAHGTGCAGQQHHRRQLLSSMPICSDSMKGSHATIEQLLYGNDILLCSFIGDPQALPALCIICCAQHGFALFGGSSSFRLLKALRAGVRPASLGRARQHMEQTAVSEGLLS